MILLLRSNRDIIEKDWCVEEPILKLKHKMLNSGKSKIVLSGGNGVGKSITLYKLQDIFDKTEHPIIYTQLKRTIRFPEECPKEEFLKYYYDTLYSQYLKKYLRSSYSEELQASPLLQEDGEVDRRTRLLYDSQTPYPFNDTFQLGCCILPAVVSEAKRVTGIKSISIAVDDFDKNPKTELAKKILIDTLSCFDRTIISVNSESLGFIQRVKLKVAGFKVLSPNYSRDPNMIRRIISRRLDSEEMDMFEKFDYSHLAKEYQGDICAIMESLEYLQTSNIFAEAQSKKKKTKKGTKE